MGITMWNPRIILARLAKACDNARMSAAYGEEAAHHYRETYTSLDAFRNMIAGFREGWTATAFRFESDVPTPKRRPQRENSLSWFAKVGSLWPYKVGAARACLANHRTSHACQRSAHQNDR